MSPTSSEILVEASRKAGISIFIIMDINYNTSVALIVTWVQSSCEYGCTQAVY